MSGALVPYVARAAANPYIRQAVLSSAKFAYKNRGSIYKAARSIRTRATKGQPRMAKRAMRNNLSQRVMGATAQTQNQHSQETTPLVGGLDVLIDHLYNKPLPYPVAGASEGQRPNKESIFMTGVKICRTFYYRGSSETGADAGPVLLNWALVQLKYTAESNDNTNNLTRIRQRMFRDQSNYDVRSRDFVDAGTTLKAWDDYNNCLPLNTEADLIILARRKKVLRPFSQIAESQDQCRYKIDEYFKINKNVEYLHSTDFLPSKPIYEIWWYNSVIPESYPSANPSATVYVRTYSTNSVVFRPQITSSVY